MLQTLAQRAWFAWHCLPRNAKGQPPAIRELERQHGLANAQLRKLVMGLSKRPSYEQLIRMAEALGCSAEWLQSGNGQSPMCGFPVPPGPPLPEKSAAHGGLSASDTALFEREAKKLSERPAAGFAKRTSK